MPTLALLLAAGFLAGGWGVRAAGLLDEAKSYTISIWLESIAAVESANPNVDHEYTVKCSGASSGETFIRRADNTEESSEGPFLMSLGESDGISPGFQLVTLRTSTAHGNTIPLEFDVQVTVKTQAVEIGNRHICVRIPSPGTTAISRNITIPSRQDPAKRERVSLRFRIVCQ